MFYYYRKENVHIHFQYYKKGYVLNIMFPKENHRTGLYHNHYILNATFLFHPQNLDSLMMYNL